MTEMSAAEAATVEWFENAQSAPESWGGGLRDALVEGLAATGFFDFDPNGYVVGDDERREAADCAADAVLALPEVAALRAKAAAADRVRELADALSEEAMRRPIVERAVVALRLYEALGGANQTDRGRC